MITVQRHGNRIRVKNPVTGTFTEMINITLVEEGRSGGNAQMSESSNILSQLAGEDVGIGNLRVHTHPVRADKVNLFPVGKKINAYINRSMYSRPQMRQQEGVAPRLIDGRPTYFATYLSSTAQDDRDMRMDTSELLAIDPKIFQHATVGATLVEVLDVPQGQEEVLAEVGQGGILGQAGTGGEGNLGQ